MKGVALVLLLVTVGFSGCLGDQAASDDKGGAPRVETDARASVCTRSNAEQPESTRPCAMILNAGEHPDREVSLATHPTDPDTALVAWIENVPGAWTVWLAVTTDAGQTWQKTNSKDLAAGSWHFDPIAAFAPNGDALVLFGETRFPTESNILVVRSSNAGATWTLTQIPHNLGVLTWDAMDLAVAPDTGALFVVAGAGPLQGGGLWFWTSDGEGATWSAPLPLNAFLGEYRTFWPRVAAYPDGVVVITAKSSSGLHAVVSRDAGTTFESGHMVFPGGGAWIGDMSALGGDGSRLDLAAFPASGLLRAKSTDAGASWSAPETLTDGAPEGSYVWNVATQGPDGALHVLATYGRAEGDAVWGAELVTLATNGTIRTIQLAGPVDQPPPRGTGAGDEYGGIAVGADGKVWWAMSDPRSGEPKIAVGWSASGMLP